MRQRNKRVEFVSIIIVNYNGAHHLKDCLGSLNTLDYPQDRLEVVVFDNGSTDDSLHIIKKTSPSARIIENPGNLGFAPPHRIAAGLCKGDTLAFLNNDMKVDKKWIREGVSLLAPSRGIVCASSKILSWNGKHTDFHGGSLQYLGYADQLRDVPIKKGDDILFPCGGAMFIKKEVFLEAGCFDDDYFAIFEDVDLGWRLWVMGHRVVMATDSVVYHKGHSTLDSKKEEKKRFLMHRNALMTIIKNYDDENLKRILPLALILAVKRSLLFMGIDKKGFYFSETGEFKDSRPDNYKDACLHLAAMDDVFESFETLIKKRKDVQAKRKRDDSEIFPLFKDPFRNIMGYKEYLWEEASLFGYFNLDAVFRCDEDYGKRVEEGIYHARKTLGLLTTEIQKMSRETNKIAGSDTDRRRLAKKFYENLRGKGIGPTVKKTGEYLRRRLW
ncbi:MAG: hypothetical protein H6Q92_864 [Nitrospirae bacterium]|nr:hypothetical protein [Nitrospirota bacterium]